MSALTDGQPLRPDGALGAVRALLTTLAGSLEDEGGIVVLLQRVAEVAHEQLPGVDCAGTTIHVGGLTYTASFTHECTLEIDEDQYRVGDGPCLTAAREDRTVLVDVDGQDAEPGDDDAGGTTEDPWPRFTAAARREGFHSFLASPLSVDGSAIGALNLYGRAPRAFDDVDVDFLEVLCSATSRVLSSFVALTDAQRSARTIRDALVTRAPIEQAKGMLMVVHGIDADAAFAMLCRESQDTNRKLAVVAAELVERLSAGAGGAAPSSTPPPDPAP
ncbi:GAF and ANTAR domain-containing protein [Rhodococcus aerolatus]